MVFVCRQCVVNFQNISDIMRHLILQHEIQDTSKFSMKCCWCGCMKDFKNFTNFYSHMCEHTLPVQMEIDHQEIIEKLSPINYPHKTHSVSEIKSKLSAAQEFVLDLDGTSLPKMTIEFIVDKTKILLSRVLEDISNFVKLDQNRNMGSIINFVQSQKLVLSSVDSSYKVNKIYQTFPDFIMSNKNIYRLDLRSKFGIVKKKYIKLFLKLAILCTCQLTKL